MHFKALISPPIPLCHGQESQDLTTENLETVFLAAWLLLEAFSITLLPAGEDASSP